MVCLFCNKELHMSINCKRYTTENERKQRPNSDRFCFTCSTESTAAHLPEKDDGCSENNKNCSGWFSTEHHTLFCAERIKEFQSFFLPKIDQNLLPRLLKTFEMDERYSMVLSSPNNLKVIKLDRVKIINTFYNDKFKKVSKSDKIVLNNYINISQSNPEKDKLLFNSINSKIIFCFLKIITISDSNISGQMVLKLLSPFTKEFKSHDSCFNPNISFSDIIKKAPNLKCILNYDFDSNIIYEETWIKDLLKYKNGKDFNFLYVKLDVYDFDVEALIKFIKTKCSNTVNINISYSQELFEGDEDRGILCEIFRKLRSYFDSPDKDCSATMTVGYDGMDDYEMFCLLKFLKQE